MTGRLRVCFAAPGHVMLSTAGGVRHILATAMALRDWVEVTLAFRSIAERMIQGTYAVQENVLRDLVQAIDGRNKRVVLGDPRAARDAS